MEVFSSAGRFEYKFFVPYEKLETLRRRFLKGLEYDRFARKMEHYHYTVRSIYLDTMNFKYYNEKIDGLRKRKKLRIRTYNHIDSVYFLEIKHKIDSVIFKERVMMKPADIPLLWEGELPPPAGNQEFADQKTINHFSLLIEKYALKPVVLISYEREAFQSPDDHRIRVTFDLNVRSSAFPALEDIFREDDMDTINDSCFILEIKFNEKMPSWLMRIVQDYDLHREAISKYCEGLDACYFNKHSGLRVS